jgi:hypothetical protein
MRDFYRPWQRSSQELVLTPNAGLVTRAARDALFAKTTQAGHREQLGPTGCSSANRGSDVCKHRSSHDSAAPSAAAVGVEEKP